MAAGHYKIKNTWLKSLKQLWRASLQQLVCLFQSRHYIDIWKEWTGQERQRSDRYYYLKPEYYNRIIWTDETMVKSHPNGEVTLYTAFVIDDPYIQPRIQNSFGVMFWGAMWRYAYGTINGAEYLQLLKDVVIPEIQAAPFQAIYQQPF